MSIQSVRRKILKLIPAGAVGAFVAACSGAVQNGQNKSAQTTQSTTNSPATGETITLRMQSSWPVKDIFHEIFLDWGKKVEAMSGGRLKVNILPAGSVASATQLIEAVDKGTLDGGHAFPAYWFGLNRAASLFGTGPSFGMDAEMMLGWIHYGGGQELYNELIQTKLKKNVISFFHGPVPTQPLGWFKQQVKAPADFKGLKYRTAGIALDVFKDMGAASQFIPGGEIVSSLERGVIDAAEFSNPSSDEGLGFPDVRKVLMLQSYHQPVEMLELQMNKSKYDSLPPDLQAIIKYATMAQSADFTWKMMDRNSKDLETIEKNGVKVFITPKSILEAQLQAWDKVIAKESADPFFKKVIDSQRAWAKRVASSRLEIMVENKTAYDHFFKEAQA
ncbi:C4-dicarboxylate ABC transporter [Hydrococcus rivularis NIES-593]|uniref:C4-dicarboxylate ABC transporter n=1 Tax=Hydrococcus rivularis NIES-593 TaxID=1921803 RepID=A0A1U7HA20_9CYAN|nr:TRAP transporter substrate-binding protein [Hydrococcus rivularis]OKH20426.1 C4-dicarboxylate ABC transporter [Hydrococcus rivularis NIES-593]